VKSGFSNTSKLDEYLDDLAYTAMVFRRAGLPVIRASLVLLSRAFRFGDEPDRLFEVVDVSNDAFDRATEFERAADAVAQGLFGDAPAKPELGSACRDCAFFDGECLGTGIAHTVLEIPNLHHKKLKRLSVEGIIDLARIPEDLGLTDRQRRAIEATLSGRPIIGPGLNAVLDGIVWPCHYLDFETVATVLPLYPGHACYQQVLTQFSIHHLDAIDAEPRHSEFLAYADRDCQRDLAEALIRALGDEGSIIVYSNFEKTRIKALQAAFPELAAPLDAILGRLVDLMAIISEYVCHPDFKGGLSIKKVLPALVPDLSYHALAIADGDTAITRFARMARGEIAGGDIAPTRRQLLEYCEVDTLAMLRVHEKVKDMATLRARALSN
jgi:hypothetical protein